LELANAFISWEEAELKKNEQEADSGSAKCRTNKSAHMRPGKRLSEEERRVVEQLLLRPVDGGSALLKALIAVLDKAKAYNSLRALIRAVDNGAANIEPQPMLNPPALLQRLMSSNAIQSALRRVLEREARLRKMAVPWDADEYSQREDGETATLKLTPGCDWDTFWQSTLTEFTASLHSVWLPDVAFEGFALRQGATVLVAVNESSVVFEPRSLEADAERCSILIHELAHFARIPLFGDACSLNGDAFDALPIGECDAGGVFEFELCGGPIRITPAAAAVLHEWNADGPFPLTQPRGHVHWANSSVDMGSSSSCDIRSRPSETCSPLEVLG
jgi:hypothetical protein